MLHTETHQQPQIRRRRRRMVGVAMAALQANLVLAGPPRGHPHRTPALWDQQQQPQQQQQQQQQQLSCTSSAPASVPMPVPASQPGWSGYGRLTAILEPVFEARVRSREKEAQDRKREQEEQQEGTAGHGRVFWERERGSSSNSEGEEEKIATTASTGAGQGWRNGDKFSRWKKQPGATGQKRTVTGKPRLGKLVSKRGEPWESGLTEFGEVLFNAIRDMGEAECVSVHLSPSEGKLTTGELLAIIKGFGRQRAWSKALQVFNWMRGTENLKPDNATISVVLRILGRESQLLAASKLFESLQTEGYSLNVYAYTSLISALARSRNFKQALGFFEQMKEEGPQPSLVTYNVIIDLYGKKGRSWDKILELFTEMRAQGIRPDEYTYNTAITACASGFLCEEAKKLFAEMKGSKLAPDRVTYNALLDVYGKAGWHQEAQNVLKEMEIAGCPPNIVTYNELLSAFGRAGLYNEAAAMKDTMISKGFEPDVFTYTSLVSAYGRASCVKEAMDTYKLMRSKNCTPNLFTFNTLIDMHGKKKNFNAMMEIFEDMQASFSNRGSDSRRSPFLSIYEGAITRV